MNRIALIVVVAWSCSAAYAVTIPTVLVGNAGNASDPLTGFGRVDYEYRMASTEVTIGQYVEFLNAVASTDTYGLYPGEITVFPAVNGIARNGSSGSYTYSPIGSPNRPVTVVSWADAARFANWIHNGQPIREEVGNDLIVTEGGAYDLHGVTGTSDATEAALMAVTRNAGARWFIPTEDEWYKAAYHQPADQGGDTDSYWLYATRSNSPPYSDQPPGSDAPIQSNTANVFVDDFIDDNGYNDGYALTATNDYPSPLVNMLSEVGAYTQSNSFYGTFDQAGNVTEWTESIFNGFTFGRNFRGGSFASNGGEPDPTHHTGIDPTRFAQTIGFRLATVPEPSSIALATLGLIALVCWAYRQPLF